jgi:hypothetical protein
MNIPLTICGLLIGVVSIIHFYWFVGGKWGLEASIPTKSNHTKAFIPSRWMVLGVAFIFLLMAGGILSSGGWFQLPISQKMQRYLTLLVGSIFILRSIGDFKHFGFFRKKRNTLFDYWDRNLFTPGTLFVGLTIIFSVL